MPTCSPSILASSLASSRAAFSSPPRPRPVREPDRPLPEFLATRISDRYERRVAEEWRDRHIFQNDAPRAGSIELHTNDYLQMSSHPRVARARERAARECRDSSVMSAVFLSAQSPHHALERALADHLGSEDAILCQSGWAANVGLLQCVAGPDVPVYLDFFAHMSLREGAARAGAPVVLFRHNDVRHLERAVERHGPGLIAVDSVYSTLGSRCPLAEVVRVARAHDCLLLVDESHSLGTHGPHGAGLVAELGLTQDVSFVTSSLSKAFAARGGVLTCPRRFVNYFRVESRIAIFSSAVHSYEALAFLTTLEVLRESGAERRQLHATAARLRAGLAALGYPVAGGTEQIIALEAGTEYRTLKLRDLLAERGVLGAAFLPPATPANRCLLRLTVTSALDEPAIQHVLRACADLREHVELAAWPAVRRERRRGRTSTPRATSPVESPLGSGRIGPSTTRQRALDLVLELGAREGLRHEVRPLAQMGGEVR